MAQLSSEEKNRISSRARAFASALDNIVQGKVSNPDVPVHGFAYLEEGERPPEEITSFLSDIIWIADLTDDTQPTWNLSSVISFMQYEVEDTSLGNENLGEIFITPTNEGHIIVWGEVVDASRTSQ